MSDDETQPNGTARMTWSPGSRRWEHRSAGTDGRPYR